MTWATEQIQNNPEMEVAYIETVFRGNGYSGKRDHIQALDDTIEKLQIERRRMDFEWNVGLHAFIEEFAIKYNSNKMRANRGKARKS